MSLSGLNISTKVTWSHCCDAFFQYDLFKVPDLDNLGEDQVGEPFQLLELEVEQETEDDNDEQVEQIGGGQEEEGEQDQQVEEQLPLEEEEQIEGIQEEGINEVQGEVVVSVIVHL